MAATEAEIGPAFARNQFKVQGDDLLGRCVDMSTQFGLSAMDLSDAYDAFAMRRHVYMLLYV